MKDKKIAVFFDCENISATYVDSIFDELAKYGEVIIKQSFRDWSNSNSKSWNRELHEEFAIEPIQVFSAKGAKNSCDMRIQRAINDTITHKKIDIIVLVSSDSDFRDIIISVRANGFETIGFGESKTPASLKNAYATFIELPVKKEYVKSKDKEIIKLLKEAIVKTRKEDDCCLVSQMGSYLKNKNSSYNPKNLGATTWGEIIKKFPSHFELSHLDKEKSTLIVKVKQ